MTGATGFIGHALLDRLAASGWEIRALIRGMPPAARYSTVKWISGDLDDIQALRRLVSGADAVIHCAGVVRGKSWNDFFHVNVVGTKNILQIAAETGICSRFLYISSLAAREPQISWYAQSKFEAEQLIPEFSGRLRSVVFRPAAVYGAGDKALKPLFQAMRYGILPAPANPANRFGLVHVSDLVAAIHAWLDTHHPANGIYEIDDGTAGGYDYASVAAIAQRVLGRPIRCFRIPSVSIRLLAQLNLWVSRIFNYAPILTPGKVMELHHPDWTCDISPLQKELRDWYPVTKFEAALPQLVKA